MLSPDEAIWLSARRDIGVTVTKAADKHGRGVKRTLPEEDKGRSSRHRGKPKIDYNEETGSEDDEEEEGHSPDLERLHPSY